MDNVVEILTKAKARIAAQPFCPTGKFVTNRRDDDEISYFATVHNPDKWCYCTVGAVLVESGVTTLESEFHKLPAVVLLAECIRPEEIRGFKNDDYCDIYKFNDNHTKEEILALFDRAIAKAQEGVA